jgi:hypothetical protein
MVISASRRSDVPAYYSPWLLGRLEAGYCLVKNPFDAGRVRRVSLAPENVDFLVLWTRDPRPLVPHMRDLDGRGLRSYVHMTITGYPPSLEPGSPPLAEALGAFRELTDAIGAPRVLWRYDPVFVAEGLGPDFHRRNFELIAAALEGRTQRVTLSLLDEYAGTRSRLGRAGFPLPVFGSPRAAGPGRPGKTGDEAAAKPGATPRSRSHRSAPLSEPYPALLADLAAIARSRGMTPLSCAEPFELAALGIEAGACVDAGLAASLWGIEVPARKDRGQRPSCGCAASVDIGAYGTCPRGCIYCYATRGGRAPRQALERGPVEESL